MCLTETRVEIPVGRERNAMPDQWCKPRRPPLGVVPTALRYVSGRLTDRFALHSSGSETVSGAKFSRLEQGHLSSRSHLELSPPPRVYAHSSISPRSSMGLAPSGAFRIGI